MSAGAVTVTAASAAATPPVIRAEKLCKWYGEVIGLNDVSLEVAPGVTGLLGPNGAGKSTFMGLITGQLRPTGGSLEVLGEPAWHNPGLGGRVGICPEHDLTPPIFTGHEFVELLARLRGYSRQEARDRAWKVLDSVGMASAADRPVATYSKGMRQRTKLAQALVHDPELLILDEPLTGMDPTSRRDVIDRVRTFARAGGHVLVSSHVLHEIEAMTDQVVLIHHGRVRASGHVSEIRGLMDRHPHRVRMGCARPAELARALLERELVVAVDLREPGWLNVQTTRAGDFYQAVPELVTRLEAGVTEMTSDDDSLKAVFNYLIGQTGD